MAQRLRRARLRWWLLRDSATSAAGVGELGRGRSMILRRAHAAVTTISLNDSKSAKAVKYLLR